MKGLSKISLPTNKTTNISISFLILLIISIGTIFISNNEISAQKAQIELMQHTINKNNNQIAILTKNNSNEVALIKKIISAPTPTPIIEYQTQYLAQPTPVTSPNSGNSQLDQMSAATGVSKAALACWIATGSARGCPQN